MVRIIHIKKAKMIESYSIGEYVGKDNTWKQQEVFQSPQELVGYLRNSNDKYAQELRGRRNLRVVVNVSNAEGESLIQALDGIKSRFDKIFIRKTPFNNHL